jgi:hypothetical protein
MLGKCGNQCKQADMVEVDVIPVADVERSKQFYLPGAVAIKRSSTKGIVMRHKSIEIDGLNIFYRESGDPKSPKLALLHGFPSSSHQYRNLMAALADRAASG